MITRQTALKIFGTVPILGSVLPGSWATDLYDDYINSTSKVPFVAFLGREATGATIGHAFVGVGVRLDATFTVYERIYGLYPKDGALAAVKSIFTPISGKIDSTWADMSWDSEINRTIDANQKVNVLDQFEKWGSSAPQYSLLANDGMNCNSMVADVARSLEMTVPDGAGSTRPWKFIKALDSAN